MVIWVLAFVMAVGVFMIVKYGLRRERRVVAILKKQESDFLTEKFGSRGMLEQQNTDASRNGFKWYKVLREKQFASRLSDDQGGLLVVKNDILIAD